MTEQIRHDPASQCALILKQLQKHGRVSRNQMIRIGITRLAARISDLVCEGHTIIGGFDDERRDYWYTYVREEAKS